MPGVPRIKLDEIFFKYKHHPTLVDLFVEGEFDRDVLNQLFSEHNLSAFISVLTVAEVEIPDEALIAFNLHSGSNKNRLIALATLLRDKLTGVSANVTCLVDADQDRVLGALRAVAHLAYTQYTCMEMHCMSTEALRKFLILGCNCEEKDMTSFLTIAEMVLPTQFSLRAINERLGLAAPMPDANRGLTQQRNLASFSRTKYVDAFIASNNLHGKKHEIYAALEQIAVVLPADIRDRSHGHDFVELLFAFVAERGKLKLHSHAAVTDFGGRLLMTAVKEHELSSNALNAKIMAAAKGGPTVWQK